MNHEEGKIRELVQFKKDLFELLKPIPEIDKQPFFSSKADVSGLYELEPEVLSHLWNSIERLLDSLPYVFRQELLGDRTQRDKLRMINQLAESVHHLCRFLYYSQGTLDKVALDFRNRCVDLPETPDMTGLKRTLANKTSRFETPEWCWQHAISLSFSSTHGGLVTPDWVDSQIILYSKEGSALSAYQTRRFALTLHREMREFWPGEAPEWAGRRRYIVRLANFLLDAGAITIGSISKGGNNEIHL